jgi:uncharacterized membrane protein YfcA
MRSAEYGPSNASRYRPNWKELHPLSPSSLVAAIIFATRGLIDWNLGMILIGAAFPGGLVGALIAQRIGNVWLRRVFLVAVIAIAFKTLFLDLRWSAY